MAKTEVMGGRNPICNGIGIGLVGEESCCMLGRVGSLSDMILGFFEEGERPSSCDDAAGSAISDDDDTGTSAERKAFWESQNQLLQAAFSRCSSLETRIRRDAEDALRQLRSAGPACACLKHVTKECRNCLLTDISDRLQIAGYNSAICKSKWRRSPDIPSGEHSYLDVVDTANAKKGPVRVVIELNFRAEFEMARASQDYNSLVSRLPEVFVGKSEKLRNVIKIVCAAAKKCMKDNNMHIGPWRKHKYMQAKWLSPCERMVQGPVQSSTGFSDRQRKLRASLLTFDLLDNLPSLQCTAVEVV